MPLRNRDGIWHYRFWVDGREYTGSTDLVATERNKTAATDVEAAARKLVRSGRSHELKIQVKPFNDAANEFLTWADGEYTEHPNTAKRLRTSFASLGQFFRKAPVSAILPGNINDYKSWRRTEHEVRKITIRHDLHALSKAYGYWIDHNWARVNPVRSVEIPSDRDAIRMHVLTTMDEESYFTSARRFQALYDVGRLIINQGCRPEEVLGLQVADVNLERAWLRIRKGKSPAARRVLRLTSEALEICARRVRDATAQWLFPGKKPGTHLTKLNGRHTEILNVLASCECKARPFAGQMFLWLRRVPRVVKACVRNVRSPAHFCNACGRIWDADCDAGGDPGAWRPAERYEVRPHSAGSSGPGDAAL